MWSKLEKVLSKVVTAPGVSTSWVNLFIQFSYIMVESVHGISIASLKEENTRQKKIKAKNRDANQSNPNILNDQISEQV